MKNAHERFGKLVYRRRTEKTATNLRVFLDAFVGEDRGKAHLVSVVGGDVEIGALAAAFANGDSFTVVDPYGEESIVSLGEKPLSFRGSIVGHGRKRPLRHLVSCSQELADTTSDGKLLLTSDDHSFIWSSLVRHYGLPATPEWGPWMISQLQQQKRVQPLPAFGYAGVAVKAKRKELLALLRKDGTPFWNRLSITPVQDHSGVVTHFIGVQSDVTEEKQAKDALQNANERLETVNRAMQKDLQAAAELQHSLLPVELPKIREMNFAFRFRPCSDVGGDSINVFSLDDQHVALYILDVSGHGVAAALLSVTLTHMLSALPDRSFLYHAATDNPDTHSITSPAEVVSRLNRHFLPNPGVSQFFTMIYGILDAHTGEFCYTAAGHFGPIHFSRNSSPSIGETGGIPVGLLENTTYEEHIVKLSGGDRLYLCTDGIMEAANEAEEEFGVERLLETLEGSLNSTLGESLSAVMERVEAWSAPLGPADDASMLAIERCD